MSDKIILRRQPHFDGPHVHNPDGCCSSDAVSVYADGSACCFSCGAQLFPHPDTYNYFDWQAGREPRPYKGSGNASHEHEERQVDNDSYQQQSFNIEMKAYEAAQFRGFPDRNITIETAKTYGVKTDTNKNVYFPYYSKTTKQICGFKIRTPDKDFKSVGKVIGDDVMLFGAQLFKEGGKYITIHEGEFDALAGYQMMGSKFPNISIPTGSKGAYKGCQLSLDYLETYERKVISFDGDTPGVEAADKVAPLFTPGTCQVISMPPDMKDANEYLKKNLGGTWMTLFWNSRVYTPQGIVNLAEDFEALFDRKLQKSIPYPWEGLNSKLHGIRRKELVTLCSGSGMGKSSVTREIAHHLLKVTDDNVGVLFLEEDVQRTKLGLMGIEANKPLHLDEVFESCTREEIREYYDATVGTGRFFAFDHFGSCQVDEILNRIRYLIKGLDCNWIILDHLSIIVSGIDNDDERKAIDLAMTKLRTLVEETGAGMFLVSHLKRVQGDRGHENGAMVSLSHLRGSQAIAQLSDAVIGLERDQQNSNPILANTTKLRVLKNRYTGEVGEAGFLLYNHDTGRLMEVRESDLEFMDEEEGEF